jgi:hypothetical protein
VRCPYNWAEGSRAIEARRGAAAMRRTTAQRREYNRLIALMNLGLVSRSLGLELAGV